MFSGTVNTVHRKERERGEHDAGRIDGFVNLSALVFMYLQIIQDTVKCSEPSHT